MYSVYVGIHICVLIFEYKKINEKHISKIPSSLLGALEQMLLKYTV